MKKIFNILAITILGSICISCNNMDYMNKKSFREMRASQGIESFAPSKFDRKKIKEYGGLVIKPSNEESDSGSTDTSTLEDENYYVSFKRQKSRVFAETLLFKADNEEKSIIDKTFFNFGLDKKKKGMSFEVTLKY